MWTPDRRNRFQPEDFLDYGSDVRQLGFVVESRCTTGGDYAREFFVCALYALRVGDEM
jgi:hypothetical protein